MGGLHEQPVLYQQDAQFVVLFRSDRRQLMLDHLTAIQRVALWLLASALCFGAFADIVYLVMASPMRHFPAMRIVLGLAAVFSLALFAAAIFWRKRAD